MRLAAWYVLCAGLLLGHALWFVALRTSPAYEWLVALLAMLAVLAMLLATTPIDAIRLPRGRSELLIIAGTAYLLGTAASIASTRPAWPLVFASAHVLLATATMLVVLRRRGASAWWAALVAWNPLIVYEAGVAARGSTALVVWAVAFIAALAIRR